MISCDFDLAETIDADAVAAEVRHALARCRHRGRREPGRAVVSLAAATRRTRACTRVAAGICAALPRTLAEELPLVLLIDGDVGMSLGRIIRHEIAPGADVIAIDGVQLKQFDYVDIGSVIEVTNVVPIIIKSLLFK